MRRKKIILNTSDQRSKAMQEIQQLKGKTIVVIGASKGIGREVALQAKHLGANLVLGSRSQSNLSGNHILELPLDVRDEQSVQTFYEKAMQTFGNVDVLINSAGVGTFTSILESSTEDFDQMLAVNLRGAYLTCKYFGKQMVEQGNGQIINLVSIAGTTALPGNGGYSASKFGLLGFTRVLQAELRAKGVQVTSVIPGAVSSGFWDQINPKPDMDNMIPVETVAQHIMHLITQPTGAFVDEITIMPPLGIL